MVFSSNPLSLSVPDPAFEAWLRDTGYLEVLDSRSSAADTCPPSTTTTSSSSSKTPNSNPNLTLTRPKTTTATNALSSLLSSLKTLVSLLSLNPFAKLTADDLAAPTPAWTLSFIGRLDSYSFPAGPSQARMRVQENVRRYARNYAVLSLIFLACSLYQMPLPLLGVVASLMLWEGVRFCSDRWEMEEKHPGVRQVLVRVAQFATAIILMQSSDSLLLCNQCQLHSDDLACFSPEVGSSKEICGIKSSEKITGKENTVGGPCNVHHNSWKKMKAVVLRGHSSSLDSNALNGV